MKNYLKKCLSFVLIFSLIYVPVTAKKAMADSEDKFHQTCDRALARVEYGKGDGGDSLLATCMKADLAREAKNMETAKAVLFTTAATVCTASAVIQVVEHLAAQTASTLAKAQVPSTASMATLAAAASATASATSAAVYTYEAAVAAAGEAACDAEDGAAQANIATTALSTAAKAEALVAKMAKLCTVTAIAANLAGIGIDIAGKTTINDTADKYKQAKDKINLVTEFEPAVMSLAPMVLLPTGASAATTAASTAVAQGNTLSTAAQATSATASAASKAASSLAKLDSTTATASAEMIAAAAAAGVMAAQSAAASAATAASAAAAAAAVVAASTKSRGCILSALGMGYLAYQSKTQADGSKNAEGASLDVAVQLKDGSDNGVTNLDKQQYIVQSNNQPGTTTGGGNPGAPTPTPSATGCAKQSGNQYLSCMRNVSPEFSAITNSSEFMGHMNESMHGQNFGDFIKGYKGGSDSDLANYVANGLGMNPAFVSGVVKSADKAAKDNGFADGKYTPMTYKSSGGAAPKLGASEDLDFSKMMAGLSGKMGGDGADTKIKDPSELVFRQMELLPTEKIQTSREISLFARIAFRYRKNTGNVDQLNWSGQKNSN